jgi:hypothetical protein
MSVFSEAKELFTPQAVAPAATIASPDADLMEKIAVNVSNQISGIVNALPGIIMAFNRRSLAAASSDLSPDSPEAVATLSPVLIQGPALPSEPLPGCRKSVLP